LVLARPSLSTPAGALCWRPGSRGRLVLSDLVPVGPQAMAIPRTLRGAPQAAPIGATRRS
jgi:hypothetical protein